MTVTEIKYDGQVLMLKEEHREGPEEDGPLRVTYTPRMDTSDALELTRSLDISTRIRLRAEAPDVWHLVVDIHGCSARDYIDRTDLMDRLEHLRDVPYDRMSEGDHAVWALAKRRDVLKDVRPRLHPPRELASVLEEETSYLSLLGEVKGRAVEL